MHMADALISTPVAIISGVAAATLLSISGYKVNKQKAENSRIVPLMGVLGAFIFAAQMLNFTIPGTGSSGHIIGGIFLAAFLGPWAAFITLSSVLIIQCLIFADGGLMALGCNILNMAAMSTLIGYPFIFKPILKGGKSTVRIIIASVLACLISLELGACAVTLETELSGITALPVSSFLALMTGIHLLIGIGEGLATAAILVYIERVRPDLLNHSYMSATKPNQSLKKILWGFGVATVILAGGLAFFASEYPDGLEWSIQKITGSTDLESKPSQLGIVLEKFQHATSIMPDYENNFAGIFGALAVIILVWGISALLTKHRIKSHKKIENIQN